MAGDKTTWTKWRIIPAICFAVTVAIVVVISARQNWSYVIPRISLKLGDTITEKQAGGRAVSDVFTAKRLMTIMNVSVMEETR